MQCPVARAGSQAAAKRAGCSDRLLSGRGSEGGEQERSRHQSRHTGASPCAAAAPARWQSWCQGRPPAGQLPCGPGRRRSGHPPAGPGCSAAGRQCAACPAGPSHPRTGTGGWQGRRARWECLRGHEGWRCRGGLGASRTPIPAAPIPAQTPPLQASALHLSASSPGRTLACVRIPRRHQQLLCAIDCFVQCGHEVLCTWGGRSRAHRSDVCAAASKQVSAEGTTPTPTCDCMAGAVLTRCKCRLTAGGAAGCARNEAALRGGTAALRGCSSSGREVWGLVLRTGLVRPRARGGAVLDVTGRSAGTAAQLPQPHLLLCLRRSSFCWLHGCRVVLRAPTGGEGPVWTVAREQVGAAETLGTGLPACRCGGSERWCGTASGRLLGLGSRPCCVQRTAGVFACADADADHDRSPNPCSPRIALHCASTAGTAQVHPPRALARARAPSPATRAPRLTSGSARGDRHGNHGALERDSGGRCEWSAAAGGADGPVAGCSLMLAGC